jgi:isopenicillin N synthase-like dioxygenase
MKAWTEDGPFWQRLEGDSQYPEYPGAKELVEEYITRSADLSQEFMRSVAECLSLPPDTFEKFKGNMDRLKFIKYPQSPPESQGVGPHKDSTGLFTFLSQDDTGGLQVLNKNGEWIGAPPIEGSLVVNIQQGFEAITGGICAATTHRVVVSVVFLAAAPANACLGPDLQNAIQCPLLPRRAAGSHPRTAQGLGGAYRSPNSCVR